MGRSRALSRPWSASIRFVRVLLGVVKRSRDQLIDDRQQCPGPIGHDLDRSAMIAERDREEPPRSSGIAPAET
jgi:hypothetical protein